MRDQTLCGTCGLILRQDDTNTWLHEWSYKAGCPSEDELLWIRQQQTWKPSSAAAKEGICHTHEECRQMYAAIPAERKTPALEFLRSKFTPEDAAHIRELITEHGPEQWLWHLYDREIAKMSEEDKARGFAALYNPHMGFGMGVRNVLRQGGFNELYFRCHNLDDIYQELLTESLAVPVPAAEAA